MTAELLNTGAQEALIASQLADMKKKSNAESWNDHMEDLLKAWGEKSAGLRFMHSKSASYWKSFSNKLTLWGIIVTTLSSTAALSTAGIEGEAAMPVMYAIGAVGLCGSLIQSLKKFYNAEEKAADHGSIAKQFGSFYRYMTLQLGMSREDRITAEELSNWALKEYERLQGDAPPLGGDAIKEFKETFKNSQQNVPDVAQDEFVIVVHGRISEEE